MLATPELIEAQRIEARGELEVAAVLQHRVFANRMVGRNEGAESHAVHLRSP
jgi:hypothetical protein